MTTSMLQLNPAWRVLTPHGEGEAWAIIDYGMEWNPVFIVALDNGDFNNYNTKDVKRSGNLTTGVWNRGIDFDVEVTPKEPCTCNACYIATATGKQPKIENCENRS